MNKEPTRVLVITEGGTQFGGIVSFLYTFYGCMDQSRVQLDFLFILSNALMLHQEEPLFRSSRVYELNVMRPEGGNHVADFLRAFVAVRRFLKTHPYEVVHINTGSELGAALWLLAVRLAGVRIRLTHSHNAPQKEGVPLTLKSCLYALPRAVCRGINRRLSTHRLACSTPAGEALFGRASVRRGEVQIIRNAIRAEQFTYSAERRAQLRRSLGIPEDTPVFCHVGVFSRAKNHSFLLDVFREIHRREPRAVLWLIGDAKLGPYKPEAEEKTRRYGLEDCVRFWGERSDVAELLQGADALLFPSLFEGLGIVAVEAQAAGLPVYASTNVTEETAIVRDLVAYLPLSAGAEAWAEEILRDMASRPPRRDTFAELCAKGYEAQTEAQRLMALYLER